MWIPSSYVTHPLSLWIPESVDDEELGCGGPCPAATVEGAWRRLFQLVWSMLPLLFDLKVIVSPHSILSHPESNERGGHKASFSLETPFMLLIGGGEGPWKWETSAIWGRRKGGICLHPRMPPNASVFLPQYEGSLLPAGASECHSQEGWSLTYEAGLP